MQVLSLKCDAGNELVTLAEEPEFALTEITCLDEDPTALRAARAKLDKRLPTKTRFLRVSAMRYAQSPMRRSQHYDISYSAVLLDHLTDRQAVALVRDYYGLLAEGGVLDSGQPHQWNPGQRTRSDRLGVGPGGSLPRRSGFPAAVRTDALWLRDPALRTRAVGRRLTGQHDRS